jgi:hypothetical protein
MRRISLTRSCNDKRRIEAQNSLQQVSECNLICPWRKRCGVVVMEVTEPNNGVSVRFVNDLGFEAPTSRKSKHLKETGKTGSTGDAGWCAML